MKRLLALCGLVALLVVPAALAGAASPTLTTFCTACLSDGSYVTVTATGLKAGATYFADVVGMGVDGVDFFWQRTGYLNVRNGSATFLVGPVSVPLLPTDERPGAYTVSLYVAQGRGTITLLAQASFTAS